jgi:hypothetical protein
MFGLSKRDLMSKEWLPANYGTTDGNLSCEVHLGIDFSEHHRLTACQKLMYPKVYRSLLVEKGLIIKKDFSEQFGIKRPYLYTLGMPHNNCGGFCVKAGLGQFKMLYEKLPERYAFHEAKEQEVLALGGLPFLRDRRNKTVRYTSMKEYREERLEQGKAEEDRHDIGGCACALPLGDPFDLEAVQEGLPFEVNIGKGKWVDGNLLSNKEHPCGTIEVTISFENKEEEFLLPHPKLRMK